MISLLNNTFIVSKVSKTFVTDTFVNVFRRRENISFKPNSNPKTSNITYFSSSSLQSSSAISIADKSSSLINNRIESNKDYVTVSDTLTYTIETNRFVLTDEYVTSQNTVTDIPLFFKHTIDITNVPRVSSTDFTLQSGVVLSDVEILDKSFNVVSKVGLRVDFDEGIIYNNLETGYDVETESYIIYYVKYSVRISNDVSTYIELLDNQNIYNQATFADLDESMQLINDGRKVYLIEAAEQNFDITLPVSGTYSFQIQDISKIKINVLNSLDVDDDWYLRITNGNFYASVGGTSYRYSIAQFDIQDWDPEYPYKKSISEDSSVLSKKLIKLNRENIYQSSTSSLYIDVLINDKDDVAVAAYTTNSSNDGTLASNLATFVEWTFTDKVGIRSVDHKAGILDIEGLDLRSDYKIISTYYFEEKEYEFLEVNFNPIGNIDILNQKVSLFIEPDTLTSDNIQTLYYLIVDRKGQVIESDYPDFNNDTQRMSGEVLFYESIPSFYSGDAPAVFIDDYTVEGDGIFLILGDVTTETDSSIQQASVFDARVAGGGVVESLIDSARNKNPEIDWYWDLGNFDGSPYPGTASYFVEVPVEVLDDAGGTLNQKEVKDIIDKHPAFGVYSVVKAYGVDPFITTVQPNPNSVTVGWRSYG